MPKVKLFNEQEVLQKAMILFWTKGYHDTSIQDLTQHLGISRSSLYDTFGGKKNLYHKAFNLYIAISKSKGEEFLKGGKDVKQLLRGFFSKVLHQDQNDPSCKGCFVVNTTTELLPSDSKLQEEVSQHSTNMKASFLCILSMGVETGQIPKEKDIKSIASLLYTALSGFRVLGKTKLKIEDSMKDVDTLLQLLD
ncbi:MAG: TetR/AcrR family transcriptional regulator [Bacteroidota bacterium]